MSDATSPPNQPAQPAPNGTAHQTQSGASNQTAGGAPSPAPGGEQQARPQQKVTFDTANIKSTYCNVCNATSTHEEVVINFGVNKTWDRGDRDLEVQLEHRIILSPYAAKRLQEMLTKLITDHEQRHGVLR